MRLKHFCSNQWRTGLAREQGIKFNSAIMEISLENRMLHAIEAEDLQLVSKLLSKGANPNKTVSSGKTCLGEAAFRGLTDIAKLLIAKSHSDKQVLNDDEDDEYGCALKNRNIDKEVSITPLKKKLDTLSIHTKYTSEKAGNQTDLKEYISKNFYKVGHGFGTSIKASKVPLSPLSDLEWDEDIGKVAANTKEDDKTTSMYKWYASILETTGAAVEAASDFTCGIDQEDAFGKTALRYACDKNNFDIFKALVDAGCKIDSPGTAKGWSVLHSACADNRIDFIQVLLAAGSDVNNRTPVKATALHIAACRSLEMVTMLADHGANLDLRDEDDQTALFLAAAQGKTEIIEFLVSRGAHINIENLQGHTPLCIAVKNNYIDTVEMLLQSGARITHYQCLLHTAVTQQKYDMVRLLANYGCGINVHNCGGDTPLLLAMALEQPLPFVRVLLRKGANVNACNSRTGSTALHVAVEVIAQPKEFEVILNTLLDYSIDIDKRASTRDTALNRAILLHKDQIAMQLIRYGADVNLCEVLTDVFGNLIIASNRKSNKLANMLIKAGHNNVGLNVDHDSSKTVKWISKMYKAPLSLTNICRIKIRNMQNNINFRDFVHDLPIPELMKDFLMMKELVC